MLEPAKPPAMRQAHCAPIIIPNWRRWPAGLAHEIKNPLSTIRLNMELLAEDLAEPQSPRDRRALAKIQLVQSECTRLENLLNDFLRFARLGQLNLQPADLNAEVTRALDFFQPQGGRVEDRRDSLSRSRVADRATRSRNVSGGAVEFDSERPAGDARRRAAWWCARTSCPARWCSI